MREYIDLALKLVIAKNWPTLQKNTFAVNDSTPNLKAYILKWLIY